MGRHLQNLDGSTKYGILPSGVSKSCVSSGTFETIGSPAFIVLVVVRLDICDASNFD